MPTNYRQCVHCPSSVDEALTHCPYCGAPQPPLSKPWTAEEASTYGGLFLAFSVGLLTYMLFTEKNAIVAGVAAFGALVFAQTKLAKLLFKVAMAALFVGIVWFLNELAKGK